MTRINWMKMTRANWLEWRGRSQQKSTRYLEDRIVFCADCEANRKLAFDSGRLTCASCGSDHWMFVSSGIVAKFKDYDEKSVRTGLSVERSVKSLKKETFFAPNAALV